MTRSIALWRRDLIAGAAAGAAVTLVTGAPWLFALGAIAAAVAACAVLWPRPDDARLMRASLVHDWTYYRRPRGISRAAADALFLVILEEDGAPLPFRWAADTPLAHRLYRWAWERGGVT